MAPRRIRDRQTGETFVMPWNRPDEPTPDDIDLYKAQKAQEENSWTGWGKRNLANALTAGKDAAVEVANTAGQQMKDVGSGVLDIGKGAAQMFNPFEASDPNDPSTDPFGVGYNVTSPSKRMAEGIIGSVKHAGQDIEGARQDIVERGDEPWSTAGMGALHAGLDLGEISGIPFRSAWDQAAEGNYSRAAGQMIGGLGLYALAKGAHGGKFGAERITDPARLLPAAGETGTARFYGGEAGMADATQSYPAPTGDLANPYWGPEDLRPSQPPSPIEAAQGGPQLPRVNRNQGPAVDTLDMNVPQDVAPPEPAAHGQISVAGLGQEQPAGVGQIQPPEMPFQPSSPVGNQLVQGFQEGRVPPVEPPAPEGPQLPTDWTSQGMQVPDVTNPVEPPVPEPAPVPQPVPQPVLPQVRRAEGPRLPGQEVPAPVAQVPQSAPIKPRRFAPAPVEEAPAPVVEAPPVEAQPDPAAQLAQIMAEKKAAAEAKPVGKGARVKAIVDQIATKPGGIQTVLGNEGAIAELAKNAGVHPESLRQALNRTVKEQAKAAKTQAAAPVVETPAAPPPVAATVPEAAPATAPKAVAPKKVAGATPDRVLRLARGTHDPVRVTFPDKFHADLFSAIGRMRKGIRGEPGIAPDFAGLAKKLGVDRPTLDKIATTYRMKVLEAAKAMPKTAEGGVVEMKAPSISDLSTPVETPAPVKAAAPAEVARQAAPPAKPVVRTTTDIKGNTRVWINDVEFTDRFGPGGPTMAEVRRLHAQINDPASFKRLAELKGETYVDLAQPQPKAPKGGRIGAISAPPEKVPAAGDINALDDMATGEKPAPKTKTTPKAATVKSSVKGVKTDARIQAKIDELSGADVENLLHDRTELSHHASEIGVKPAALRAALERSVSEANDTSPVVKEMKSKIQTWLKESGGSETGALRLPTKAQLKSGIRATGKLAGKAFDAVNQARMTSMLSGLALPKSLIGNVGSHLTAALEGKTLKPLQVAFQVKNIARDLKTGWTHNVNPAQTSGIGRFNLPGRAMGAADYAAMKSLMRAGMTEADAREILLTNANTLTKWKALQGRVGQTLVPFRTISSNQFEQGMTRWKKYPAIYAGAVVLGAVAGKNIKDKEALALAAAFTGPYAGPFLAGAAITQGGKALEGISPIPEWGIIKTMTDPFAAFKDSPGRRWARSNLGFGAQAAREHRIQKGQSVGGGGRGRSGR
jgi:hypothetical protein